MNDPTSQTATADPHTHAESGATVSFVSLGCPKNLVDSEKMLGLLAEAGVRPVSFEAEGDERVDAVVVNTCGFLEASKEESLGVIRDAIEAKREGRVGRVVVAGCLVQRHRAKMLEWAPGIDSMIGVFDRDHILGAVLGAREERQSLDQASDKPRYWIAGNALQAARERNMQTVGLTVQGKDGKGLGYFEDDSARLRLTPRHYAYLKVSEGCNQKCAFCTIPSIRGKMRSKPLDRIVAEARELIEDGAFEINLIGQDTTSYGDDIGLGWDHDGKGGGGLPALLRELNDAVDRHAGGHGWVRLMYAYPTNFRDEFIEALADLDHIVKYIDIPLQHASDRMLTSMRRNVTASHQKELLLKLRERIPHIAIRTTMITGFPGETEEDHEQLLEFIDEVGFEALGVFEYSREPGTPAGTMDQDPDLFVPAEIKARRHHEIMALQQSVAFEQVEHMASLFDPNDPEGSGAQFDVLIDKPLADPTSRDRKGADPGAPGVYQGRAYFQAVDIDSVFKVESKKPLAAGELVRCVVTGADGYDFIAKPLEDLTKRVSLRVMG